MDNRGLSEEMLALTLHPTSIPSPAAWRKVEDVVFSTQEVALPGHSEDFIRIPWRWGSSDMDSKLMFHVVKNGGHKVRVPSCD